MTKHNRPRTAGESMTADDRMAYIRNLAKSDHLSHEDLALLTGYSRHSVSGWFTDCDSRRHRDVPARAIDLLRLRRVAADANGTTSTGGQRHVSLFSTI
ncbi:hypothetical protein [Pseudomonas sp. B21-019]|uniref:hypothetical protein n=1 Tax=Pseudomonas sp. B21-019 TaxID=2895475 RepID=UPI00215FE8A8|nr:hypothetical protein [Pseudomonas sp. B21-019]UVM35007.1 hypothetical protein LOY36_09970 [Pseudomonas sp. B21-019]